MGDMLQGFFGAGALGMVVKHLIPSANINKFIPLINTIGAGAFYKSQGQGWMASIVAGAMTSMAAKGGHAQFVKSGPLGNIRVPVMRGNGNTQGL